MDADPKTYRSGQGDYSLIQRSTGSDPGRFAQLQHADMSLQKRWLLHGLPETLALLLAVASTQSLLSALIASQLLRMAWVAAEVIHGTGHTLARALVDTNPRVICLENLLEHRSAGQMAQALLPLAAIGPAGWGYLPEAWLDVGDPAPWKLRLKASGGILLHGAVLAVALAAMAQLTGSGPGIPLAAEGLLGLILSNLWLALASRSDLQAVLSGQGTRLYCGNFGLVASPHSSGEMDLLSSRAVQIFHRMGRETELRGAQAGGGLVMTLDRQGHNCFVGHKIVNAKRGDLTPSLEAGFRRRRRQARHGGFRTHPAGLMACWHYRFGTSGPPAVRETHWQEWSPARRCRLWRLGEDGLWHSSWQTVHHRVTHNGDFETYEGFGSPLDVASSLGPWLDQALHQPSPAVVDSARIAGMMDLLICQGDWYAAVRWGFLSTLAAFPHTPSAEALERWAHHFEGAFLAQVKDGPAPAVAGAMERGWILRLTEAVLPVLRPDPLLVSKDDDSLRRWIAMAIDVFLHNDPCQAVVSFMEGARGSFGLVVVSTTWPDRLVLSSLGQPITIGFHPTSNLALYASESAAVDGVLQEEKGAWRIDLDANAGEIAVLSSGDLRIRSLSLERELYPQEVLRRRHPYAAPLRRRAAPSIPHPSSALSDPVAADITEIPALLAAIHDDWSNPGSSNRQSADALAQLLIAKASNIAAKESVLCQAGLDDILAKSNHLDLLITGVENSLWLGEQFAKDLSSLMPRLTVRALSANAVLQALQHNMESLALARQSIVLVLSHSSRTFPSRQVMEACDLMVRTGVIRELFILTGEPESLLGSQVLAVKEPGEPFTRRLFTTGAGRRRAEPATASVAAMHQTLTQLLFTLGRQVLQAFPDGRQRPLGMGLSRDDLTELDDRDTKLFLRESREIVGADGLSQRRPTSTSRQLERGGRHWAQHVLEAPMAWAIHGLYILITVALGLPLVQTVLGALAGGSLPEGDSAAASLLRSGALAGDVGLYIFGPWLWTLGLRWGQGRPLGARTGRRSLVVGEAPWIHPLLTNYISKLFSLSYGIASLDVQGADVGDHLLHTHAHRLVRGSLLFLGFPDGRSGNLQRAEADAALLTARQSDGIRHWNTGPEIVALGTESSLTEGPFRKALILPCATHEGSAGGESPSSSQLIEGLRESRFGGFRRLLASYVFFWAMARDVGRLPLLRFKWWRSQSRTRVMTTAAPVSAAGLDLAEPREIAALSLDSLARREQS